MPRMRLANSPMMRATYQAMILSACSNILAQFFQARRKNVPLSIDPVELLRFVLVTLLTAPPNFQWQQLLERTFPAYHNPKTGTDIPLTRQDIDLEKTSEKRRDSNADHTSADMNGSGAKKEKLNWRNTLLKMFIDSITLGALVNTVVFLGLMGILKGHDHAKLMKTIKRDTFPVILSGYKLWPMVSLISFTCIPVDRRIVFFSAFGLGWNIYMSLVAAAV